MNSIQELLDVMGEKRILDLVVKGQKYEEGMRKRMEYNEKRMEDPEVAERIKEQRRIYSQKRNERIRQALRYVEGLKQ